MKATGIVRHIDELGRIVIPKEMRKKMEISSNDPVEIFVEGDRIILTKYHSSCTFCVPAPKYLIYGLPHWGQLWGTRLLSPQ